MFSPRYVILLLPAIIRHNQAIHGRVMTSYQFFKMAAIVINLLPGSGLVMAPV